jgi:hypothetical protein
MIALAFSLRRSSSGGWTPHRLCVPKTSSTSGDQAIFVDQAADVSVFSDAVLVEVDTLG